MKVSLAALRINATPATIRPALRRNGWPQSAERLPRRDLCHLCIQKPAFVEIAAYSTRYPLARQTTDDTNEVKFAF